MTDLQSITINTTQQVITVSPIGAPGNTGPAGPPGGGFDIYDSRDTWADLPTDLTPADKGQVWLVNSESRVYVWSGTAWPAQGTGASIVASGGADVAYTHDQPTAAQIWTITHNLGKHPSVSVVDSAGTEGFGTVKHLTANSLTVSFSAAFAGKAYLN